MEIPAGLLDSLRSAGNVVVLTGAGTSAESGVPTFREAQTGLWQQYDPHQLATPQAFQRQPRLVWEWYTWRRQLVAAASSNAGHLALVRLQDVLPGFTIITQNVDGLHQQAGSKDVVELHGNIGRTICSSERNVVMTWEDTGELPPRCPQCGAFLRPDVVWFGESLPHHALKVAFEAVRSCDVFLSIGTSALVQPAAALPMEALRNGAVTVEVNPAETAITFHMTYALSGPSGRILPTLADLLTG